MESARYIRRPFVVEATEITEANIDEVAALIGKVKEDEDRGKHIAINLRVIPGVPRAFIGWWLTKMGENYRVYSGKTFRKEFSLEKSEDKEPVEVPQPITHEVSPDADAAQATAWQVAPSTNTTNS